MLHTNFSPFPEIETQRLLLRRITKDDIPEIFILRSNDNVMKYIDRPRALSLDDATIFFEKINEGIETNDGITWGITLKENPKVLIGSIGYWRLMKEHYRAEIGYMLHPDFWQKGIMKEALTCLIDYAFTSMNLHSIEANLNSGNMASAKLLEATGFVKEAHFKEDFFFDGSFRDTIIYSRLQ